MPEKNNLFIIFSEKGHCFDLQLMKDDMLENLKNAADADDASNIKQAYLACLENGVFDEMKAIKYFDNIKEGFEYKNKISEQVLRADIFNYYKKYKIHNEKYADSKIQMHIDTIEEKYLKYLFDNSSLSKINNSPIAVDASMVDEWIDFAKTMYGVNGYNRRFDDFKKNYSSGIIESKREVIQLRKIGINDDMILSFLIDEIFYKDFRNFYTANDSKDIDSLESKAYNNFQKASIGYDLKDKKDSLSVFTGVINKTIEDPLIKEMSDSQYCSDGCYIFLTSDDAALNVKITWINE